MTLDSLDYWRLAEELSVVDASLLAVGLNPGEIALAGANIATSRLSKESPYGDETFIHEADFRAVFKAVRSAILGNNLRADLAFSARTPAYESFSYEGEYGLAKIPPNDDESRVDYTSLLRSVGHDVHIFSNKLADLERMRELYILNEPNWRETMVNVEEFKAWLESRGLAPEFFFPKGRPEGFRDKSHPRYSPKLGCAVAAWEAVKRNKKNTSVKAEVVPLRWTAWQRG